MSANTKKYNLRTLPGKRKRDTTILTAAAKKQKKALLWRLPPEVLDQIHEWGDWQTRRNLETALGWNMIPRPLLPSLLETMGPKIASLPSKSFDGRSTVSVQLIISVGDPEKRYDHSHRHFMIYCHVPNAWWQDENSKWIPDTDFSFFNEILECSYIHVGGIIDGLHIHVRQTKNGKWKELIMDAQDVAGMKRATLGVYRGNALKGRARRLAVKATCSKPLKQWEKDRIAWRERWE